MNWFSGQLCDDVILSPEEFGELCEAVSKERVRNAAREYSLDTVYTLCGKDDEE